MPRQPRLDAPGTLHHVMGRGIEASKIFRTPGALKESAGEDPAREERPLSPEEMVEKKEIIGSVRQALRDLEDEDREILILKHYQEMTFKEIGTRLGIPENTAKTVGDPGCRSGRGPE